MEDFHFPRPRLVYRALGLNAARERVGVGVMSKAGIRFDQTGIDPPTCSLVYVLRGRGRYRDAAGRWYDLVAGACFLRIPGRTQSTELDPGSDWLEAFVDLGSGLAATLLALRVIRPEPPVWNWGLSAVRVARFATLLAELDTAGERELPELCVRCQALVVEALRTQDAAEGADDPVDRLCRLLADEAGTRLDLRAFCRRERLDFDRFRKDFARRVGQSPGQYRIRRRIERACSLLMTTDADLARIAEQLGYSSAYEFSAQFRQWTGLPPGRWRAERSSSILHKEPKKRR